jgi:hypothetical protein
VKRRAKIVSAVFLILLAITVFIWLLLPPREPSYQGRPASQWMADMSRSVADDAKMRMTEDAIRNIGTNAVPFVLRELRVKEVRPWHGPTSKELFARHIASFRHHAGQSSHGSCSRNSGCDGRAS